MNTLAPMRTEPAIPPRRLRVVTHASGYASVCMIAMKGDAATATAKLTVIVAKKAIARGRENVARRARPQRK